MVADKLPLGVKFLITQLNLTSEKNTFKHYKKKRTHRPT